MASNGRKDTPALYRDIMRLVEKTLTRPLTEPLILKFNSDDWEMLYHEAVDPDLSPYELPSYNSPISIHTSKGEVRLQRLVPLPPLEKDDLP